MRSFKILGLGFLIILLIGLSFNCKWLKNPFGSDTDDIINGNNDEDNVCSNHPVIGKVGDTIKSCIFEVTLKSVEVRETVCDDQYEANGKYIIPEINVKNIAEGDNATSWFISYTLFYIKDSNNNRYYQNNVDYLPPIFDCFSGLFIWDHNGLYNVGKETGFLKLIFDVPDAAGLILVFHSTETENVIEFDLGNL